MAQCLRTHSCLAEGLGLASTIYTTFGWFSIAYNSTSRVPFFDNLCTCTQIHIPPQISIYIDIIKE